MKDPKDKKSHRLNLYLTEREVRIIKERLSKSTLYTLSAYVRVMALNEPITFYTRSKSLDLFIEEMTILRKELHQIENDFHKVAAHLASIENSSELRSWAAINGKSQQLILEKMIEIKEKINQIADTWIQRGDDTFSKKTRPTCS